MFLGNLEKILPVVYIFSKDLQFMPMKVSCMLKNFSPPTEILEIPLQLVVSVETYLYAKI